MSYSEGDDSDGSCEGFPADDDERDGSDGEGIDNSTDGDAKSGGDENTASDLGAWLQYWSCSVAVREERRILSIPAQHHAFIFTAFVKEHQLIC